MQDMGYSKGTWTVPQTGRCTVGPLRGQLLREQGVGGGGGGGGVQQWVVQDVLPPHLHQQCHSVSG